MIHRTPNRLLLCNAGSIATSRIAHGRGRVCALRSPHAYGNDSAYCKHLSNTSRNKATVSILASTKQRLCSNSSSSILRNGNGIQMYARKPVGVGVCMKMGINTTAKNTSTATATATMIAGAIQRRCYSSSASLSSMRKERKKLSVAIVGSGPSGFYSAKYLHLAIQKECDSFYQQQQTTTDMEKEQKQNQITSISQLDIDLIDRLPTPFGLVRSGVAPDHPEVKNVENDFVSLVQKLNINRHSLEDVNSGEDVGEGTNTNTSALTSSLEFRGNVTVGEDVSLEELRDLYDVVVLAYGCESDKKLGIPIGYKPNNAQAQAKDSIQNEKELKGIYSAREFVAWYNGHPDYAQLGPIFQTMLCDRHPQDAHVVVIGQGNVALDCARILAKGRDHLVDTDIASHSLPVLKDGIKQITVVGRRGHVQGAFTIKELRELTKLEAEGCDTFFHVREDELRAGLTSASLEELKKSRPKTRINKLLSDVATASSSTLGESSTITRKTSKQISLRFMLSPIRFIPDKDDETKLGSVLCEKCELQGEPFHQVAIGTGILEEIPANMALVSIGYKGTPLPGMDSSMFNEKKGIVQNQHGRVAVGNMKGSGALYVSGWLKRGPSGIIGTNIVDAKDTVVSIMEDLRVSYDNRNGNLNIKGGRESLDSLLMQRGVSTVNWKGYEKIDAKEKDSARLRSRNQPREKITSLGEMLELIN